MELSQALALETVVWVLIVGFLLFRQQRRNLLGVGLVLAYLANLWLIHWPAAVIYLLPWYTWLPPEVIEAGLRQSTLAVFGFAVGVVLLAGRVSTVLVGSPGQGSTGQASDTSVAYGYMLFGIASFLLVQYVAGQVATLTAVLAGGLNFLSAGLGLASREAWLKGRHFAFAAWLFAALMLPLFTTVSQGFAGFGVSASIGVLAFVAAFYRPTRHVLVAGVLIVFIGLSFYESYFRDRGAIRAVVWGGEDLPARIDQVWQTLTTIEWFDPTNQQHLLRIDGRLDQNYLVGSAVRYLDSGLADWAGGETVSDAATALIPRAIWPSKPTTAGSGNLVARFTGMVFAQSTSVGIGNVMEWYVNFGSWGVFLGEVLLGAIVGSVDLVAGHRLQSGDWRAFARWFVPGLGLIQVGGSFVEVVGTVAAAALSVTLVTRFLLSYPRHTPTVPSVPRLARMGQR